MRFLLAGDDPDRLDALAAAMQLHWEGCTALTARDGVGALALYDEHDPAVVVLGAQLPGGGLRTLQQIRQRSDTPVLILAGRPTEGEELRAFELEADDYVPKDVGLLILLAKIRAILRRRALPAPGWANGDLIVDDLVLKRNRHQVLVRGDAVDLTPFEYRLLAELMRNVGRLMPYQALLTRVWGVGTRADSGHIKQILGRLRQKIEDDPANPRYLLTERLAGYRMVRPTADASTCEPHPGSSSPTWLDGVTTHSPPARAGR